MRVVLTCASLSLSYGGPAFSVSRLARALAVSNLDVGLWAADQSARTTPVLPADTPIQRLAGTEAEALDSFGKSMSCMITASGGGTTIALRGLPDSVEFRA